jgi:hypothetical protein
MVFILASEHLDKHHLYGKTSPLPISMKVRSHYRPLEAEGTSVCGFFQDSLHEFTKIFDAQWDSISKATNSRSNDVSTETPLRGDEAPFMDDHKRAS